MLVIDVPKKRDFGVGPRMCVIALCLIHLYQRTKAVTAKSAARIQADEIMQDGEGVY